MPSGLMFWDKTWHVEDLPNKNHSALCGLWTGGKPSLYTLLDWKKKEFFLPPLRPHPSISSLCADGAPPLLPIYCIWTETGTWASCAILSTTCMQDKILIKRLIFKVSRNFQFYYYWTDTVTISSKLYFSGAYRASHSVQNMPSSVQQQTRC